MSKGAGAGAGAGGGLGAGATCLEGMQPRLWSRLR